MRSACSSRRRPYLHLIVTPRLYPDVVKLLGLSSSLALYGDQGHVDAIHGRVEWRAGISVLYL